jgi:hypothetical protein
MYLSQQFRDELFTTLQEHDDSGTLVWEMGKIRTRITEKHMNHDNAMVMR